MALAGRGAGQLGDGKGVVGGAGNLKQPSDSGQTLRGEAEEASLTCLNNSSSWGRLYINSGLEGWEGLGSRSWSRSRPRREGKAGPRLFLAGECGQGHWLTPHPGWKAVEARAGVTDWGQGKVEDSVWLLATSVCNMWPGPLRV